jgi:hypothetical protein
METEPTRPDQADDETPEEFKEEIENDPSTASSQEVEDDGLDRLRGG